MPYKDPEKRRECHRKSHAKWKQENRESYEESQLRWREANRERSREYARRYAKENPEGNRRRQATRRARKLRQFIEAVDPQTVFEMHGGMCGICGEFISGDFHVDHIVPLSKGGMHGYINCQPAHPVCNLRKGSRV